MNSHMAKNSEWGAIVYLTHSKFGKDGVNNISKGLKLYSGGKIVDILNMAGREIFL